MELVETDDDRRKKMPKQTIQLDDWVQNWKKLGRKLSASKSGLMGTNPEIAVIGHHS